MSHNKETPLVYVNGKFMKKEDAKISVFDSGFLSGDAIFEGVRAYNGKLFRLDEHIELLFECAHALKMDLKLTKDEVKTAVFETLRINNFKDSVHIRIQISRGKMSQCFMNPSLALGEPTLVIYLTPGPGFNNIYLDDSTEEIDNKDIENNQEEGAKIITSSIRRPPPDVLDQKIHSTNKHNSLLAKVEANLAGVDEALMLDLNGFVAECAATTIFFVKDKRVLTSNPESCKLGVTRQVLIQGANELGYEVLEKNISIYEVYNSDECFMCGTHGEIVPITEVDGRKINYGKIGTVFKELQRWYFNQTEKEGTPIPE